MEGYIIAAVDATKLTQMYNKNVIYDYTDNDVNHAVVIVGHGVLNGTKFWLVHNSWGDIHNPPIPSKYKACNYKSYFMVKKGENCLGIESNMYAIKIKPF
jgi:hypothetical protein